MNPPIENLKIIIKDKDKEPLVITFKVDEENNMIPICDTLPKDNLELHQILGAIILNAFEDVQIKVAKIEGPNDPRLLMGIGGDA